MSDQVTPLVKKIDISSLGSMAAEKEKTEKKQVEKAWELFEESEATTADGWLEIAKKIEESPGYADKESIQLARAQALTNAAAYATSIEEGKKIADMIMEIPLFKESADIQVERALALTNASAYAKSGEDGIGMAELIHEIPSFETSEKIQYQMAEVLYNASEATGTLEEKEEILELIGEIPKFDESDKIKLLLAHAVKNIMMDAPDVTESRKTARVITQIPGYGESDELQCEYATCLLQLMSDGVPEDEQKAIWEEIMEIKGYRESDKLQYEYAVSLTTSEKEKASLDWSNIAKRIASLPKFEDSETILLEYARTLSSLGLSLAEEGTFEEITWEEVIAQFEYLMGAENITPFAAGNIIGIWISMHNSINEIAGEQTPDFLSFEACFERVRDWLGDADKSEDTERMPVLCESVAGFSEQFAPEIAGEIREEIREMCKPHQGYGMFRE